MSWIKVISYAEATGKLKQLYNRIKGPDDNVDNVMGIHSLRPHTLNAHMILYKSVLHHNQNVLPKWYLESLGTYVSHLNKCDYCFEHHSAGLKRLIAEDKFEAIQKCIQADAPDQHFEGKMLEGMHYAKEITMNIQDLRKDSYDKLIQAGYTDGEILEINQVVSYFNYANRTVLGLGVNTEGDILGLSPNDSDDPNNWSHA